ncbi:MAG: M3 family metallopeptidase [Candidatus Marinimicrobia bacterium]|jgi:peptidyl-dipeptidase Dcp|nr:M3 family metallopeptidase [Candidatus Neomarinimicrobiota bacterium]MBT3675574.1 M3 family metallopeptidase [Candidatus Neomarinimicrobiota bacterium]MBT3763674.1 M3 family metallopeptidase [Candidatus Neomarinimicrobiota bacterium]MBT4271269.1 M3 family metallopeptidase [Candidatus Neomarinimicrobiota bacterium]MBT4372141.1 M3 family metallopeptidase [Candidatus Neomarinimicrobiota bacterium]
MKFKLFTGILSCILFLGGCTVPTNNPTVTAKNIPAPESENPFYKESPLYFKYPQFDKIKNSHYTPAFEKGMAEHMEEVEAIANSKNAPTFENTIVALEISGALLDRVATVFFSLTSANTNDDMEKIRSEMAPKLSAHSDQILLNGKLFERVMVLHEKRNDLDLDAESLRLVEKYYTDFVRAGAKLSTEEKERLKSINSEMAVLQTTFSQNVLKEVNALAVVVNSIEELDGLSNAAIEAAANEGKSRELEGKYVITLRNTSGQPPMSSLTNRALRERIHKTSLSRGSRGGDFDNRETLAKVIKLRAERSQLMGYANHAAYSLENQTAQTTDAVNKRLSGLAPAAMANANREAADLQKMINAEGGDFELASWDWTYYTEKVRADRYNFDASQLKPYFEMDNVLQNGVFYAANQLFGISFKERFDLPVYQEDVRVFEVFDYDGSVLALFIYDGYARSSKRGGAWMNAYVGQSKLKNNKPVIANHQNITKPPEGDPTLLTFEEVITMFHEFGHALHGMFSDVNYPYFAGTSVPRDFVEYPSQVNEMWAIWPEVLKNYAVHHETGEAMPKELLDKVLATQKFNQGFATTEYLAASILDQALHQLTPDQVPESVDLIAFEADALKSGGVAMDAIPPRYRSTYFSHIIGGYSAGYYSYIWSEVLDADTVEWFKENGGLNRKNGDHFRRTLLSRGGSEDAMVIFKDFRGSEPNIQPLLDRRGLN